MTADPPFDLHTSFTEGAMVLELAGEVDMTTAPHLEEALLRASDTVRLVVCDLSEVTFLDSSGLNTLVRSQRMLGERGIALRLVSPHAGTIHRVFEVARLTGALTLVESRADALA